MPQLFSRRRSPQSRLPGGSLTLLLRVVLLGFLLGAPAHADRVRLEDGRVLVGSFANVAGVKTDPFADRQQAEATPILVCDNGLSRTFVPRRRVVAVEQAPEPAMERIGIPQRVTTGGRRMAQIGGILEVTPFDEWGRRIFSVATPQGREDVVQGITEINPRYTKVEGLITEMPIQMDTRIATSSIPRVERSSRTRGTRSERSVGSPPVSRTRRTPRPPKIAPSRTTSARARRWPGASRSAGEQ